MEHKRQATDAQNELNTLKQQMEAAKQAFDDHDKEVPEPKATPKKQAQPREGC